MHVISFLCVFILDGALFGGRCQKIPVRPYYIIWQKGWLLRWGFGVVPAIIYHCNTVPVVGWDSLVPLSIWYKILLISLPWVDCKWFIWFKMAESNCYRHVWTAQIQRIFALNVCICKIYFLRQSWKSRSTKEYYFQQPDGMFKDVRKLLGHSKLYRRELFQEYEFVLISYCVIIKCGRIRQYDHDSWPFHP